MAGLSSWWRSVGKEKNFFHIVWAKNLHQHFFNRHAITYFWFYCSWITGGTTIFISVHCPVWENFKQLGVVALKSDHECLWMKRLYYLISRHASLSILPCLSWQGYKKMNHKYFVVSLTGETVVCVVKINNASSSDMSPKFSLKQDVVYRARGSTNFESNVILRQPVSPIKAQTRKQVKCVMKLPRDMVLSIQNFDIISVEYRLKVCRISLYFQSIIVQPSGRA